MAASAFTPATCRLGDEPRNQYLICGAPRSRRNLTRDPAKRALGVGEARLRPGQSHIGGHDLAHLVPQGLTVMIRVGGAKIRSDRRTRYRPDQLSPAPLSLRSLRKSTGHPVGENQAFKKGVRCQTVGTMNSGARYFTDCPELLTRRATIEIGADPSHRVVQCRGYWDQLLRWIDSVSGQDAGDPGEPVREIRNLPRVEPGTASSIGRRDGAGHDIPGRQFTARIRIEGEAMAIAVQEESTGAPHRLGNEGGRVYARKLEGRRMELQKFEVSQLGTYLPWIKWRPIRSATKGG